MFIYLFVCTLLIPLTMLLLGNRYRKKPPKDRNGFSGYRTTMSRLNQDTWNYAHNYVGKIWIVLGVAMLIVTSILMFIIKDRSNFELLVTFLTFLQIAVMIFTIIPTEIKLKRVFDKNGHKR